MTTKTLETVVIPVLKHAPFLSKVTDNGHTVLFVFKASRFTSHWTVVDHTKSQVLAIEARNIVTFPPDDTDILKLLNDRLESCIGKFWLADQKHLKYCLELPYTEHTTPGDFQHALFLALDTVATNYLGWWEDASSYDSLFQQVADIFGSAQPHAN
jgi:hypothetical protein